jgi:hypothetical protein
MAINDHCSDDGIGWPSSVPNNLTAAADAISPGVVVFAHMKTHMYMYS